MPTLEACAKVNLGLAVLGRRADGFHDLDTLFARLTLHDTLALEPGPSGVTLTVEVDALAGAALGGGPDNLVYGAAERYLERYRALTGEERGVALHLVKRIPLAAGFGGGSSDAAAALRGLASLYPAPIDLLELGAGLGSDVPFFVQDVGAAWGGGRGERLEPLAPGSLPPLALVLVNPGVPVSAGEAYGALERFDDPLERARLLAELADGPEPSYRNSLEPGVLRRYPAVSEALGALRAEGLRGVLMSGSGSSCFGLARDAAHAERVARALARPGWWVRAASTG